MVVALDMSQVVSAQRVPVCSEQTTTAWSMHEPRPPGRSRSRTGCNVRGRGVGHPESPGLYRYHCYSAYYRIYNYILIQASYRPPNS